MLDVRDTGTELKDGRLLHHLESRGGASIPLSAIGSADPAGDGIVAIDFYVEDDGTPALMEIEASWTQVSGSTRQPATMSIQYRFVSVGRPVAITAPPQVWSTFSSKRYGYMLAYPSDWEATQSPKKSQPDSILSADNVGVFASGYPTNGYSLNAITAAYVKTIKRTGTKASVASNTAVTVDGSKARRDRMDRRHKGTREWDIDVLIVRGKKVYIVEYSSLARITPADRSTFDAFLSTLDLPGHRRDIDVGARPDELISRRVGSPRAERSARPTGRTGLHSDGAHRLPPGSGHRRPAGTGRRCRPSRSRARPPDRHDGVGDHDRGVALAGIAELGPGRRRGVVGGRDGEQPAGGQALEKRVENDHDIRLVPRRGDPLDDVVDPDQDRPELGRRASSAGSSWRMRSAEV